ncbi:diacylglycerol kinase [Bowmanella pacifica]|uniref:Diacylglycerol kinase n=1 Tax=Bowmanella pacifica TaxID=502051 RepID=A0A917YYN7_9ALTE|nr:diacylglycerol kinase [Bowmanella pacifica]GGO70000.1 diacylglycerol kinase [Bowmanella pacifica]
MHSKQMDGPQNAIDADKPPHLVKAQGITRLIKAGFNSCRAFCWLCKHEAAFRQEILLLIVLLPVPFLLDMSLSVRLVMIISLLLLPLVEILNTAIEAVVDRIGPEFHSLSGLAKDLGSAAVLLSMLIVSLVWGLALYDYWT